MNSRQTVFALLAAVALAPAASYGQVASASMAKPPADQKAYDLHYGRAKAAAQGVAKNVLPLCAIPAEAGASTPAAGAAAIAAAPGVLQPARVFDNLYFVGLRTVSAWAVKTSDGIILIDALNNAKDVEQTIVPNMRALGLDPAQIKYLIITHAHGDHYGGGQYIADHFHPRIISSDADWKVMEGPLPFPDTYPTPPPKRDMVIADGHKLTLGDTTVTLYVTPGHTPGTISLIIPVKDRGQPHVVAFWGGTWFNFPTTAANFRTYADSAQRFVGIAVRARADVLLSNHSFVDDTSIRLSALAARKTGEPNPFIDGPAVRNFFTVAGECARAREAAL